MPVGATVSLHAFLRGSSPRFSISEPVHFGNGPLSIAKSLDSLSDSSLKKAIIFLPISTPSSESYATPSFTSRSANPITPSPSFLVPRFISSISGIAYLFASITLSKNLVVSLIVLLNFFQSISTVPSESLINLATSIDPKLHDSFGSNGCSPQGLVAVIIPTCLTGLFLLTSSRKIIPGSPFSQAPCTIFSNTFLASSLPASTLSLFSSAGFDLT